MGTAAVTPYTVSKSIQGIGAQLAIGPGAQSGATASSATFTNVLELTDIPHKAGTWDRRETTNFNTLNFVKEYGKGLYDAGTFDITGNAIVDDPGQLLMEAAFGDRYGQYLFQLTMPLAIGQTKSGNLYTFTGLVMSYTPIGTLNPDKTIEVKATIQLITKLAKTMGS